MKRSYGRGTGSLRDWTSRHCHERCIELTDASVRWNRPDVEANLEELEAQLPGLVDKVHFLDVPLVDIASRDIRDRVASGKAYRYLVPRRVADYIAEQDLYR